MSFADDYLQKHAIKGTLTDAAPGQDLQCIITIPAYNESGLLRSLDSLFQNIPVAGSAEVIILLNEPENASPAITKQNRRTFRETSDWMAQHKRDDLVFHVIFLDNLPGKHYGAGLARKIVMDEAVSRFNLLGKPDGIILSLDADTVVQENYISEVAAHFIEHSGREGCSIRFEHPLEGDEFGDEVYRAIMNYELHQHYYLHAVRSTGFPFAFHTVGSCFAVRTESYCRYGGMSKRQAGEDFYFIQKVASNGKWGECHSTKVFPSPRPSDRVPFGTGPDIIRQLERPGAPYLTFHPESFDHIRAFYDITGLLYASENPVEPLEQLHHLLRAMLHEVDFLKILEEIKDNVASEASFRQRFFRKFNMLWILKYLHFVEDKGMAKMEIGEAARQLLLKYSNETVKPDLLKEDAPTDGEIQEMDIKELLLLYRKLSYGN